MANPEAETVIVFHYDSNTCTFYTTRVGEKNQMIRRLGKDNIRKIQEVTADGETVAWELRIDLDILRNPYYVSPVINK